ncbi:hypothetical protein AHiyo6_36530, partial [Arthrobacter sp. Hiyo6]
LGMRAPELSRRLLSEAALPPRRVTAWGQDVAPRYVRLVYATEPISRLRGVGQRVRAAL